jgi:threonine dehydrogenase-like Zn-dependent dehydrogenase
VVITCVSRPEVQTAAVELLATHGRLNFFAGLGQGGVVPIDTNRLHYKGLVLTGTTGSSNADYGRALALVGDGRADVEQLVSRTFAIDDVHDALAHAASGQGMKAMVVFDDPSEEQA